MRFRKIIINALSSMERIIVVNTNNHIELESWSLGDSNTDD